MFRTLGARFLASRTALGGGLAGCAAVAGLSVHASSAEQAASALDPAAWKAFELVKKDQITHNTVLLR